MGAEEEEEMPSVPTCWAEEGEPTRKADGYYPWNAGLGGNRGPWRQVEGVPWEGASVLAGQHGVME